MSGPGSGPGMSNSAPPPNKRLKLNDSNDSLSSDQQLWKLESELPDELAPTPLSTCDSITNNGSLLPATNVTLINPSIPISIGISSANVVNTTSATTSVTNLPSSLPAQNHHQLSQLLQSKTQSPNVSVQPKMIPTTLHQHQQQLGGMVQVARPGPQSNQLRYGHPNIQQQQQQLPHMQMVPSQYVPHQNFGPIYS